MTDLLCKKYKHATNINGVGMFLHSNEVVFTGFEHLFVIYLF